METNSLLSALSALIAKGGLNGRLYVPTSVIESCILIEEAAREAVQSHRDLRKALLIVRREMYHIARDMVQEQGLYTGMVQQPQNLQQAQDLATDNPEQLYLEFPDPQ